MVKGVGVDILEIERFGKIYTKWGARLLNRIFNKEEIPKTASQKRTIESLSGKFAAKEAVSKAYGTGIGSHMSFKDIIILKNEYGKPVVSLKNKDARKIHLSISHTDTCAIAFVVLEVWNEWHDFWKDNK